MRRDEAPIRNAVDGAAGARAGAMRRHAVTAVDAEGPARERRVTQRTTPDGVVMRHAGSKPGDYKQGAYMWHRENPYREPDEDEKAAELARDARLETFLMTDQPEQCRKCGARTDFEDVDADEGTHQLHNCLSCGYRYWLDDDTDSGSLHRLDCSPECQEHHQMPNEAPYGR